MNGQGERLSIQELIRLHSFQFYFWLISLTLIMNVVANKWLMYVANSRIDSVFTYNYSFGKVGVILLIPAFIITVLLIKGWNKIIYSEIGAKIGLRKVFEENGLAVRGAYGSAKGIAYIVPRIFKVGFRTIKYSAWALLAIAFFLVAISSGGTSSSGSSSSSGGYASSGNSNRKAKEDADWKAKQSRKDANHAIKHAVKQARYNPNSHHLDSRINRANSKINDANDARRHADKF